MMTQLGLIIRRAVKGVVLEKSVMAYAYSTKCGAVIAAVSGLLIGLLGPSSAWADGLTGSWSGSGSVVLPSGSTEKARCKVSFNKAGSKSYGMSAVCASSSAKVSQTGSLEQVGPNKFAGDFTNAEYGVTGSINVTLNGNSASASLRGGGGSAFFNLSR
jgi:hypothetical protein